MQPLRILVSDVSARFGAVPIAAALNAREHAGFVWAIGQEMKPSMAG
jgi:hypothetical protein